MTGPTQFARIGLVLAEEDHYSPWYQEALRVIGFDFEVYGSVSDAVDHVDILLLCGAGRLPDSCSSRLEDYLSKGKALIVSGGDWSLGRLVGWQVTDPVPFGRSYAEPAGSHHRLWPHGLKRFLFLGGTRLKWEGSDCIARFEGHDVVAESENVVYIAPHAGQLLELIGMGRGVCADAIGPQDGSANLINGTLRAEDGIALDWYEDRSNPNGGQPMFAAAPIDSLLDLLARVIIKKCEDQRLNTYIRWHWPDNAQAAACATVECETRNVELVLKAGQSLTQHSMSSTFLFDGSGLKTQEAYRALRSLRHDFGLSSKGLNGAWDDDSVRLQRVALARATNDGGLCFVRPAEGRWEGYMDFYERSAQNGLKFVSSKGGRQPGTSGYAFGFSRPLGVCEGQVTEIPYSVHAHPGAVTLTQVLTVADTALRHHGLVHLSFGLNDNVGAEGFLHWRESLMALQSMSFKFLSANKAGEFDQARRNVRIENRGDKLHVVSREDIRGFTLQILGTDMGVLAGEKRLTPVPDQRYGALLTPIVINLEARMPVDIAFETDLAA